MTLKMLVRRLMLQYVYITSGVFIGMTAYLTIAQPDAQLSVGLLWKILLFCLLSDLPALVFYTRGELTRRQWLVRSAIHTVLLGVLMVVGHAIGLYSGVAGGAYFALLVLGVDVFVHALTYAKDRRTANEINKRLRARKEGLKNG